MRTTLFAVAALATLASGLDAQGVRIVAPGAVTVGENPNAARIGVYLGDNGIRDTLGVLVGSVMPDGPAAKAGLREGDRIQAVGSVNLRMTADDAGDSMLNGMMGRRLTRELDKLKAGDAIELRVWSDGSSRTVRVTTVAARELASRPAAPLRQALSTARRDDRASLGLSLGGSTSRRDTLGVFVMNVVPDGPAERAGIVEGDRIARINSVDLRVPTSEAGDAELAQARTRRLSQELARLAPGDVATLTVVSGGRSREVRVTTVRASELPSSSGVGFFFRDGLLPEGVLQFRAPAFQEFFGSYPRGVTTDAEIREHVERALQNARESMERARETMQRSLERTRTGTVRRGVIRTSVP
jgi:serine protease Do